MKRAVIATAAACALSACAPTTRYVPPVAGAAPEYKENANYKPAKPQDELPRGDWWDLFSDPELTALENQVTVSNQTLKAVEAQYVQARAIVSAARSSLYPQVNAVASALNARTSGNRATSSFHDDYNDFIVGGTVSYEIDAWGRIRNTIESARTLAQASAADLETARLSLHAELAADYFTLRGLDRLRNLLDTAVTAYTRALELTQNRFRGGIASQADVDQAETQLESTRAQAVDVDVQRAQLEHAIAVLIGQPASLVSLPVRQLTSAPPSIPTGVPSELLERRPDIASAERRVASASAQVGITQAAYYPLLMLGGTGGFESKSVGSWLAGLSSFWAVGPSALQTVFDAGRRHAIEEQARAGYTQAVAIYQETVLSAFRDVEDQISTLRVLEQESAIQDRAVDAAERSLTQATNRYRGGVVTYLEVISAQSAALANERTAVGLLIRRMNASVFLLKGLGGGWTRAELPVIAGGH
jgi:NodT family efflux transporter outer membrane factor (OMF) lipoprotein